MKMTDQNGGTSDLLSQLSEKPHAFLQPTPDIATSALALVKELLDPVATEVADAQKARREQTNKKRKRGDGDDHQILQLRKVYTNGLGVRQVWEQARRILDAACDEVERALPDEEEVLMNGNGDDATDDAQEQLSVGDEDEGIINKELAMDGNNIEEDEDEEMEDFEDDDFDAESIENIEEEAGVSEDEDVQPETYLPDPNGLNDGFFSIDDFNKHSQFLEQMDARGDEENPSDEDEIDWDTNPLSMSSSKSKAVPDGLGEEDEGEEDGPTFGNADPDASDSEDELDEDAADDLDAAIPVLNNANDIKYAEFFVPPPKKLSKTKRMRALPKTQPPKPVSSTQQSGGDEDLDADVQRAINDVNRDIFASESEASEDNGSDLEGVNTKNMSTHEKQRAKIAAEIRRLEAASVAKRDWTLSGEARAADRPVNSVIDEDLEFERVGKPVPVVTAETTEGIEALIKRRIIAREFDEVVRRRPDAIGSASETRRGRFEVDDKKAETGLAHIYEQEHLKSTDPNYMDKRSAATKKQHAEIDKLWKDVSYQLDLLNNLHFKPKRMDVEIKTVEDKPTISMEDARPVGEVGESMLAPQEVYRAGEGGKRDGEVIRRSGASANKEEMSREEKVRKRRREKERLKKQNGNTGGNAKTNGEKGKKTKGEEKQDILADLRKGNVKVIDKKGDLQSLAKKRGHIDAQASSSTLKL